MTGRAHTHDALRGFVQALRACAEPHPMKRSEGIGLVQTIGAPLGQDWTLADYDSLRFVADAIETAVRAAEGAAAPTTLTDADPYRVDATLPGRRLIGLDRSVDLFTLTPRECTFLRVVLRQALDNLDATEPASLIGSRA